MKIGVIGGGVAGSSVSFYLASMGLEIYLFEKRDIVSGPPMCHLHAGGNLYREIDLNQHIRLLKESIEFARLYPNAIDVRPTIITTPITDEEDPKEYIPILETLQQEYEKLIKKDRQNSVLGDSRDYFKLYYRYDLEKLKELPTPKKPQKLDDWLIPFAKNVDLDKLKYPIFLVQEYGINVFRVSAIAKTLLDRFNVKVINAEVTKTEKRNNKFIITYKQKDKISTIETDYLINAAGFESGKIDKDLSFKRDKYIEFKAAYVTKWKSNEPYWPEIIFHGKRGTPQGMAQFTPYFGGYFQLHGMTKDITLFKDGITNNTTDPKLKKEFLSKIDFGWSDEEIKQRTLKAIKHISQFMPSFINAKVASKPLFGAQQIPGYDPELRAAEISFEKDYARCEIVKANSIFAMADEIVKDLIQKNRLDKKAYQLRDYKKFQTDKKEIDKLAMQIAKDRGYPAEMGLLAFKPLNIK